MLYLNVESGELYDEVNESFITTKETNLQLEHSLVSLSKWESKWCKPFLDSKEEKTTEQIMDYIRCMTITKNVDPNVYKNLTQKNIDTIMEYINAPMTATWFSDDKNHRRSSETVTNELIYYWMISLQIPFECEKWHLNRLMTLIRVCTVKNTPPKKMSKSEILSRNHALNQARLKNMGTHG